MQQAQFADVPARMVSRPLDEGDPGTIETVRDMCQLIDEGSKDPEINRAAVWMVRQARVPQFDFEGERRAVYRWIRQNVRFIRDIDGKETLRAPRETLLVRAGDCDCQTILCCALLKSIGQRVRIITIATQPQAPDLFSHVYAEVRDEKGRWLPVDSARRQPKYGRGPANWFRRWAWDTDDASHEDLDAAPTSAAVDRRSRWFAGLNGLGLGGSPEANGLGAVRAMRRQRRRRQLQLHGLGQEGFDWSQLESEIPQMEQGTAQIIAASRANPLNITATSTGSAVQGLTPAAQALLAQQGYGSGLSSVPTWMWLLGAGAVVFFLARGR